MFDPIAILVRQTKHLTDGTYLLAVQMEGYVLLLHQKIVEMDFVYDPKMPPKGTYGWDATSVREARTTIKTLATKVIKLEDFESGEYAYAIHETPALPAPILPDAAKSDQLPAQSFVSAPDDWTLAKLTNAGAAFSTRLKIPPYVAELQDLRTSWNWPCYINAMNCRKIFSGTPEYVFGRLRDSGFHVDVLYDSASPGKALGVYFAATEEGFAICKKVFRKALGGQTLPDVPKISGLPAEIQAMVTAGYEFSKLCGENTSLLKLKSIARDWEGLAFVNIIASHEVFGLTPEQLAMRLTHAGIPARILEDTQNGVTRVVGVVFSHEAYDLDHAAHKFAALREHFGG